MARIEIDIDASGLKNTLANLIGELDTSLSDAMTLSLDIVAAEARTLAPISPGSAADGGVVDSSGFLRRSIGAGPVEGTFSEGGLSGTVSASAPYALHVEYGTKPHVIKPRTKRALRWASAGGKNGWAFAKQVNHPGTAARPFLRPALTRNSDAIVSRFQVATRLAIARAKAGAR